MHPTRYEIVNVSVPFWQRIKRLVFNGKWETTETKWVPVRFGEPGYAKAPMEESIIWHKDAFTIKYNG